MTADLRERGALRSTPAGLPALDATLQHVSEISQSGSQGGRPRLVTVEIKARAIGELAHRLAALELGTSHEFAGYIGCQRNGRGIVFHVTEIV